MGKLRLFEGNNWQRALPDKTVKIFSKQLVRDEN